MIVYREVELWKNIDKSFKPLIWSSFKEKYKKKCNQYILINKIIVITLLLPN